MLGCVFIMILKKRLSQVEKFLIVRADVDNYTSRYCEEHGVFQSRKDTDTGKCPYCKKECEVIDNIEELRDKYCS